MQLRIITTFIALTYATRYQNDLNSIKDLTEDTYFSPLQDGSTVPEIKENEEYEEDPVVYDEEFGFTPYYEDEEIQEEYQGGEGLVSLDEEDVYKKRKVPERKTEVKQTDVTFGERLRGMRHGVTMKASKAGKYCAHYCAKTFKFIGLKSAHGVGHAVGVPLTVCDEMSACCRSCLNEEEKKKVFGDVIPRRPSFGERVRNNFKLSSKFKSKSDSFANGSKKVGGCLGGCFGGSVGGIYGCVKGSCYPRTIEEEYETYRKN